MTTKVSSDMWFESEQMVKNPDRWPVWPFLPVKKPNESTSLRYHAEADIPSFK